MRAEPGSMLIEQDPELVETEGGRANVGPRAVRTTLRTLREVRCLHDRYEPEVKDFATAVSQRKQLRTVDSSVLQIRLSGC